MILTPRLFRTAERQVNKSGDGRVPCGHSQAAPDPQLLLSTQNSSDLLLRCSEDVGTRNPLMERLKKKKFQPTLTITIKMDGLHICNIQKLHRKIKRKTSDEE